MKLDWESGIGRQEAHRASQTLREGALQMRPLLKGCLELSSAFHFFAFECRRRSSRSLEAGPLRWTRGPVKRRRRATLCNFSEVIVETPTGDTCPD